MNTPQIWLIFLFLCIVILLSECSINSHSSKLTFKQTSKDIANPGKCYQEALCISLQNATCFGTALPYSTTSVALAEDSNSLFEVQDNLAFWQGLRSVPRCWAVVQPLLCAVYMPKCENGTVFLPSLEMCRITRGPCRTVEVKHAWPSFLQCDNKKLFTPQCRNPLQEIKFNTSYKCITPLIETDDPDYWYHEIEGCGIQCQSPFFTKHEHDATHNFIFVLSLISFFITALAMATFVISWEAANRYPGIIVFYINMCLAFASFGWLIQFFPGAREEIVCLHDGTIRQRQPRSGEHLCSITFVLVYYFALAGAVWFVILAYAWYIFVKDSGTSPQDLVKKRVAYFHLAAWCIPLVLTTCVMAMKEVDGDSMSGICFVGHTNSSMRLSFLFIPIMLASIISSFFLISVIYKLKMVRLNSEEVTNKQSKKDIKHMLIKIYVE